MANPPQAYVLVGPTASGKSPVAQRLAEQTGAPVVSADSMNIYRGMDIGTAKPSVAERGSVNYFGIDLANPTDSFSVDNWLQAVAPAFGVSPPNSLSGKNNEKGGQPPIVSGGTGLYVKCLLAGLKDLPAADEKLRARAEQMTRTELQAEVRSTAPEAYKALADKENPRRLVRVLEKEAISHVRKGGIRSDPRGEMAWEKELPAVVGLYVERAVLHQRISSRVDQMYADGLIEEARNLIGLTLSVTAEKAIGYAEAFAVLRGTMTESEAKERTVIRTRQLAKRQMTWFRNQLNVQWIETQSFQTLEELALAVSAVLEKVPVSL